MSKRDLFTDAEWQLLQLIPVHICIAVATSRDKRREHRRQRGRRECLVCH